MLARPVNGDKNCCQYSAASALTVFPNHSDHRGRAVVTQLAERLMLPGGWPRNRLENAPRKTEAARLCARLIDQFGTTVRPGKHSEWQHTDPADQSAAA